MEIMKSKLKSRIKQLSIICLIVCVFILYLRRIIPKDFSSFFPKSNSIINGCIITNIDKGTFSLDDNELKEFLYLLEDTQYYYDGHYDNIFVGNIFHVEFVEENNGLKNLVLTMIISDENIAYIEDKQYNIKSESTSIIDFLYNLH